MDCFHLLGQSVILADCISDCNRLGHVWAVPEDTLKPERLIPVAEKMALFF